MATKTEIDYLYSTMDRIWRLSVGEMADFTGSKYDGDFSLTIEEAQRRKHEQIVEQLNISAGSMVVDIGCDWGPVLNYLREIGAMGTGITLSKGQHASCINNSFDAHILIYSIGNHRQL